MIDLHRISQIPTNCQCKWLSAFPKARESFLSSFPSPEKFLCCTDKIETVKWLNLVPRVRLGDCFEIHHPHWELCDPPLSSHQTFRVEVLLRQCVFCKEPLSSWLASKLRKFWKVSQTDLRSPIVIPFFLSVLSCWWIAPVSWCGFVTSLCCSTWRCACRVLRCRCGGRTGTRIERQSRDNDVFRFAYTCLLLFGQPWLLTAGPLTSVSVFFTEFAKWQNCRRVIEHLHRHEEIRIVNV